MLAIPSSQRIAVQPDLLALPESWHFMYQALRRVRSDFGVDVAPRLCRRRLHNRLVRRIDRAHPNKGLPWKIK